MPYQPNRTCELCRIDQPVANFPNLSQGFICAGCMMGDDQRQKDLDEAAREKARQLAVDLGSMNPDDIVGEIPKVKTILSEMYRNFGGPAGFANQFFMTIEELSKRKPMPASVAQLMLNFLKLHHSVEQTDEAIEARQMTDEQLAKERDLALLKMVTDAAGAPEKIEALKAVLAKQGLSLQEATPDELLDVAAKQLPEGRGANRIEDGVEQ